MNTKTETLEAPPVPHVPENSGTHAAPSRIVAAHEQEFEALLARTSLFLQSASAAKASPANIVKG